MRIAILAPALFCALATVAVAEPPPQPGSFWSAQLGRLEPLLSDVSHWLRRELDAVGRPRHLPEPPQHAARRKLAEGLRVGAFVLPHRDPTAIVLDGEILEDTPAAFGRAIARRPGATVLRLNSGGGYVWDALSVARQVADRHLATSIPAGAGCYSACAYIYLAGREREVQGALGVHQIDGDPIDTQLALSDLLDMLTGLGVAPAVISLMLRTPPDQMHVFTPDEIAKYGLASQRSDDRVR